LPFARRISAARSEPIVFLFGACGPSGAEGRARDA
jgi:hypothetical protein